MKVPQHAAKSFTALDLTIRIVKGPSDFRWLVTAGKTPRDVPVKPSDKTPRNNQHSVSQLELSINFLVVRFYSNITAVHVNNRPD